MITMNAIARRVARVARVAAVWTAATLGLAASVLQAQDGRPDVTIDTHAQVEAVTNLATEVEANYPDAAVGAKIAATLRRDLRGGRYAKTSARELASALTADLRRMSGDPHFLVDYFVMARTFPATASVPDPVSEADQRLTLKLQNFGFARVERLPGNVGYLKLDHFELPATASETLAAAMQFVAGTDALIVDLRDNGGGSPGMVTLLASYFFADPTHLSDIIGRDPAALQQAWTYPAVPGPHYLDKPVYILSGPRTFSAAESFAYDLQALKRATIVGETTRGGANVANRVLLSSRFGVIMPIAHVRNAVTGRNWEGGLKPDVSTTAASALPTAYLAALEAIAAKHRDDPLTAEIEKQTASLRAELATGPRP